MNDVKRGSIVRIDGKLYTVTFTENYGFFVKGRTHIILWSDKYEVVRTESRRRKEK